jgi:hypothetical protein
MATDTQDSLLFHMGKLLRANLALSEFTVIDTIRGFYDHGDRFREVEPQASAFIRAKWKPIVGSDMLLLNGQEIEPNEIEFMPTKD